MIEGDSVVHEITLPASIDEVFAMFVDPNLLIRWIGLTADLDPRSGGRFRFEVMPGQFCEGRYVTIEPPHHLVFTWGWTDPTFGLPPGSSSVEVTLEARPAETAETRLRLVHTGLATAEIRLLHDDGWSRFLDRLVTITEGRETAPYPTDLPQERLESLKGDKSNERT